MSYIGDFYSFHEWMKEQFEYTQSLLFGTLLGIKWIQLQLLAQQEILKPEKETIILSPEEMGIEIDDDQEIVFELDFNIE